MEDVWHANLTCRGIPMFRGTYLVVIVCNQLSYISGNGWDDIGYNFLVGEDGNAYEGRGWDVVGAHALSWNNESHGICMMGTFHTILPNQAALDTITSLMQCGISQVLIVTTILR